MFCSLTNTRKKTRMSHKVHSKGNVPFKWEKKPGVCKVMPNQDSPAREMLPIHLCGFQGGSAEINGRGQSIARLSTDPSISIAAAPTNIGLFAPPKLPPPPCLPESRARTCFRDRKVRPPPGGFQPRPRRSSKKGLKDEDDPFLTAYKECTKSARIDNGSKDDSSLAFGLKKNMSVLSCKHSCSVRDDGLIRISQFRNSK